jgi:tetraacyldisaccharide 4'-kinase
MSLLERIWWAPEGGRIAPLLAPLAVAEAAFRAGAALRARLYERGVLAAASAGVPVISIGNVAVGGAGKTPAAIAVAARLAARGRNVAVLSRGYGASRTDARIVADGARLLLGAAEAGDEPALLARRLPGVAVLCGPRRAELARLAVRRLGADALVLDDGFQHRALARDLDVVVLDAANPFGNGHLLPRGPNREAPAALRRAGLVWLSRVDQADAAAVERLRALAREATGRGPVASRHAPVDVVDGTLARSLGKDALRGERVLLLSGLARPGAFRRTVEALGAAVGAERAYPDHHRFTDAELGEALRAAEAAGCARVVMTEKDAVRLPPAWAADARLCAVRIVAEIVEGEGLLDESLDAALTPNPNPNPNPTRTPNPNPNPTSTSTKNRTRGIP